MIVDVIVGVLDVVADIDGVRDGVGVMDGSGGSKFKRTDMPLNTILISVVHLIYIC